MNYQDLWKAPIIWVIVTLIILYYLKKNYLKEGFNEIELQNESEGKLRSILHQLNVKAKPDPVEDPSHVTEKFLADIIPICLKEQLRIDLSSILKEVDRKFSSNLKITYFDYVILKTQPNGKQQIKVDYWAVDMNSTQLYRFATDYTITSRLDRKVNLNQIQISHATPPSSDPKGRLSGIFADQYTTAPFVPHAVSRNSRKAVIYNDWMLPPGASCRKGRTNWPYCQHSSCWNKSGVFLPCNKKTGARSQCSATFVPPWQPYQNPTVTGPYLPTPAKWLSS